LTTKLRVKDDFLIRKVKYSNQGGGEEKEEAEGGKRAHQHHPFVQEFQAYPIAQAAQESLGPVRQSSRGVDRSFGELMMATEELEGASCS